ncbi:MAG: nitroreductase, partial [Cyclobacteriaceae bacterium]
NLSLQAQYMGIAVHQMAGIDWKRVHKEFNIPEEEFHVTTAIAIGHFGGDADDLPEDLAKSERKARSRKPLNEIVYDSAWAPD